MSSTQDGTEVRRVRLQTVRGCVEGALHASPVVRTLDDINMVSRGYLTLHDPVTVSGEWKVEGRHLALAKSAVLFVQELDEPAPRPHRPSEGARFSRSPVRLWVEDFSVQGFLHVPRGGSAMARLNQTGHAFIALTSVSVIGPGAECATPFLAINRDRILAAQEMDAGDPAPEDEPDDSLIFDEFDAGS